MAEAMWLIGCGNMAGAMVEGWRAAGVDLSSTVVIRPSGTPVEGVRTVADYAKAGPPPKLAILGFKPQQLDDVAPALNPWLTTRTVLVSILAGVEAKSLRTRFPKAGAIVRAAPNLPVSVRRGVVGLHSDDADTATRQEVSELFAALGYVVWAQSEEQLRLIGSVAGAGPAYVARFVDALAKAGARRGLDDVLAQTLALETMLGTAWMAAASGETMDSIPRRVASPNGTTQAGLDLLDPELDDLVDRTIEAAERRAAELAGDARR